MNKPQNITIADYDYDLPENNIAQFPAEKRELSKLLVYNNEVIKTDIFKNIGDYLPKNSLLLFNNTKVIKARLFFTKSTGAKIEILCLAPHHPAAYNLMFAAKSGVVWQCMIGNLKKWKPEKNNILKIYQENNLIITAENLGKASENTHFVKFEWNDENLCFANMLELLGDTPLPPYINRTADNIDLSRYQTVYAQHKGSVAAPTAGLHFTDELLNTLKDKGIKQDTIVLHVGAGTFLPVKSSILEGHTMHTEHISFSINTIENIYYHIGKNIVAVGTTTVRTLESIYWFGVALLKNNDAKFIIDQWIPYESEVTEDPKKALKAVLNYMHRNNIQTLHGQTSLLIAPGYTFRFLTQLITNFHQPQSTLLLLVSAFIGNNWKSIYEYAKTSNFQFLSYGDACLFSIKK